MFAALAATATIAACGEGDDGNGDSGPTVGDIPAGAVAIVGDEVVTKRELDRRLMAVRRSQGQTGSQSADNLRLQAMAALLQQVALEREAEDLDVRVTDREVGRLVARARRQFDRPRDFRQFLGRQTERDLARQLRIQALAEKLEDRARSDGADPEELIVDIERRWRERTVCRAGYVVPACGNERARG